MKNSPKNREKKTVLKILSRFIRPIMLWFSSSAILSLTFSNFSTGSPKGLLLFLFTSPFSACLLAARLQTILTTVSAHSSKDHLYSQTHLLHLPTLKSEPFLYLLTSISEIRAFFSLWNLISLPLWICHLFSHPRLHFVCFSS